jgi:serine/threonine protein kinase
MHRDIKPENIMFKVKNDIGTLKIVDFGLATRWDLPQYLHPKCGTPGYVAPEIA